MTNVRTTHLCFQNQQCHNKILSDFVFLGSCSLLATGIFTYIQIIFIIIIFLLFLFTNIIVSLKFSKIFFVTFTLICYFLHCAAPNYCLKHSHQFDLFVQQLRTWFFKVGSSFREIRDRKDGPFVHFYTLLKEGILVLSIRS